MVMNLCAYWFFSVSSLLKKVRMYQTYFVVVPVTKQQNIMTVEFYLWLDLSSTCIYVVLLVARRRCADSVQKSDKDDVFDWKKCWNFYTMWPTTTPFCLWKIWGWHVMVVMTYLCIDCWIQGLLGYGHELVRVLIFQCVIAAQKGAYVPNLFCCGACN